MTKAHDASATPRSPAALADPQNPILTAADASQAPAAPAAREDPPGPPQTTYGRQTLHNTGVGAHVYIQQLLAISRDPSLEESTIFYVAEMLRAMKPRDALERMLIMQALWTHARLGRLSLIVNQQDKLDQLRTVNDACDRAANTFRKQLLALAEYRRPPRADAFVAIKQANVAQQQVVTNGSEPISAALTTSNEVGSAQPAALPADGDGARSAATCGTT